MPFLQSIERMFSGFQRALACRRLAQLQLEHRGVNVQIHHTLSVASPERLWIGDHVYVGPDCWINATGGVRIGSGTIIGPRVTILSANHRYEGADAVPYDDLVIPLPVDIGENVWIAANVTIVPGITIGEGCVVGAGAVITSDVPPCRVIGGNPAVVIKMRDSERYVSLKQQGRIYLKLKSAGSMSPHLP